MYRIHNQTNSPYQIDTRKGVTVVPAYGSVIADLTDEQRDFLEGYSDYLVEPVSYDRPAAEPLKIPRNMHNHNDAAFMQEVVERNNSFEATEENTRVASPEIHAQVDAIVANHKASEREKIIAELTRLGVAFDGRMGVKKLRKLLDATNR